VAHSLSLVRTYRAFDGDRRGERANGTVVRTGREVERSRGQGARRSRSPARRVTDYEV